MPIPSYLRRRRGTPARLRDLSARLTLVCAFVLAIPGSARGAESNEEGEDSESDSAQKLHVETVAEAAAPGSDPRHPSGWVTHVEPTRTFARGEDLAESLRPVEGLTIRRRSSVGQPAFASVRGGSPRQLTVQLNGIRVGAPAGVGFDLGSVPAGWLDSVDVYRGGAAAPWGSGALTGALDLQARPPDSSGWSASATMLGGSFGTVGIETEAAGGADGIRGDAYASWRKSRGDFAFRDAQGERHRRLNNHHEQLSVGGTVGSQIGGGDLNGALLHRQSMRGAAGPSEFQRAYAGAGMESRPTIGTLDWDKPAVAQPDWGVVDLKLGGGGMHRPFHYRNPSSFLSGASFESRSWKTTLAATSRVSAYFDAGNIAHLDLEARTEYYRSRVGRESAAAWRADRQTLAVGLSDELLLFDQSVSLIGGLRSELVRGRNGLSTPLIPAGGLVWRALDWLHLRANLSRSYRSPDFDELYLRTELVRGNPDLEPELALNADAGVRLGRRSGAVRGSVTLYRSHFREMILFLPRTAYLFEAQNLGPATTRGIEATASLEIGERFRTRSSYTFTDARLDSLPSVQLPHHPRHRGSLTNRLQLAGLGPLRSLHGLSLRAGGHARSGLNLDNFGNLRNPPFWQLDFGATIRPNHHFAIDLQVRNATDNRRGADYLQRPLPGRTFFASVEYRDGTLDP